MINRIVPLFLITLIVAIPQLSETIYSPALPKLARFFSISNNVAEYTLTIYLIGFGIGTLFWGNISDRIGRKPALLIGFFIYCIANFMCYFARHIEIFMAARFLQAVGACVGSVIGQAIARDAIRPEDRGRLFSSISIGMAFAPAIGPVLGVLSINYFSWNAVFLLLTIIAILTMFIITMNLPETLPYVVNQSTLFFKYRKCFSKMIKDKRLLGFGMLIGYVNGILFGYFAESPFYFMKSFALGMNSYSLLSFYICIPLGLGGFISKRLHKAQKGSNEIIRLAILSMLLTAGLFSFLSYFNTILQINNFSFFLLSLSFITVIMTNVTMIIPNCFSQALNDYGEYAGTAASLFGFYYYLIISCMTSVMGYIHNGTIQALPTFFLLQALFLYVTFKLCIVRNVSVQVSGKK